MAPSPQTAALDGQAASFAATTMTGEKLNFPGDFRDKVVLLDFWATWCGPCVAELPHVKAAHDKFSEQGFEVVGVSLDALQQISVERVESFTQEREMPWPQVYGDARRIARQYGVTAIPATFLVDGATGKILASGAALTGDGLTREVERALAQR